MEHQEENEAIVEPDEDGGWVDTHHHVDPSGEQAVSGAQESFAEMTLESDKVPTCLLCLSEYTLCHREPKGMLHFLFIPSPPFPKDGRFLAGQIFSSKIQAKFEPFCCLWKVLIKNESLRFHFPKGTDKKLSALCCFNYLLTKVGLEFN